MMPEEASDVNKSTPVMMAHGIHDEVVPAALGKMAHTALEDNGFSATWQTYPMQHNVCVQEIQDISRWLQTVLD